MAICLSEGSGHHRNGRRDRGDRLHGRRRVDSARPTRLPGPRLLRPGQASRIPGRGVSTEVSRPSTPGPPTRRSSRRPARCGLQPGVPWHGGRPQCPHTKWFMTRTCQKRRSHSTPDQSRVPYAQARSDDFAPWSPPHRPGAVGVRTARPGTRPTAGRSQRHGRAPGHLAGLPRSRGKSEWRRPANRPIPQAMRRPW
jgi:hypothetical protein